MEVPSISVERQDGLATIVLNRPAALNALTPEMLETLSSWLDEIARDASIHGVLLTGAGRAFCSGADLGAPVEDPATADAGAALESHYNPLLEKLFALPVPLVTAVNGPAAGGGCSLALAGDVVVAARSAYFLQAFINIGLVPDVGATWLLPRLVGRNRASAMMMLGERISADQALDWGMVYAVCDDDELMAQARALAERLARGPTRAYQLIRHGIRRSLELSLTESLALERDHQRQAGRTQDFAEGVAAFRARRAPLFQGQ